MSLSKDFKEFIACLHAVNVECLLALLTTISGVRFEDAAPRAVVRDDDGLPLRVISLTDLIANKRATNRPQDRLDLADLLAVRAPDE